MANASLLHRRAARILPEVIKTSGIVLDDDGQRDLASMLFAMRRRPSGSVVFRLSEQTVKAMGDEPLAYLCQGRHSRAGLVLQNDPVAYRSWHSALLPTQVTPGKATPAMPVFFTSKADGNGWVIVVPAERLAIYAWCDKGSAAG